MIYTRGESPVNLKPVLGCGEPLKDKQGDVFIAAAGLATWWRDGVHLT